MGWLRPNKERERFYLLAGMGGRALRRKHRRFLIWAILVASVVSFILGAGIYFFNKPH